MSSTGYWLAHPDAGEEVVISGVAGRFPDSDNVELFIKNLYDKIDLVTEDSRRWLLDHSEIPNRTGKINNINRFDANFFGVHYKQAHMMEPMSRMLLEHTFEAVVDAGINPKDLKGTNTGVFIGNSLSESDKELFYENVSVKGFGITGCSRAMYANRISYWLDVHGPSYTLDSACSSSCTALEHAYRSIREGICDSAIVGGCQLCLHPYLSLQFSRLGVLSMDGHCCVFDDDSNGYVRSEAVGVILLQKAKDAKRVYARVVHAKLNCDGYKPQGITFPSKEKQQKLFQDFYKDCDISPSKIEFLEAHGTGSRVGDFEEVEAITSFFVNGRMTPLKIGSVKSNMGHSEPAAGVCSIAKVILGFEKGYIPPNINFKKPRQSIESLVNGQLKVVTEKTKWTGDLVAINSFGFGGANCHILLKRWDKVKVNNSLPKDDIPRLVCISGRTEESVNTMLDDLERIPIDEELIALYHNIHRQNVSGHIYRGYILLQKSEPHRISRNASIYQGEKRPIWFVFSGMGSQWPGMGLSLMKLPIFAAAIKRCAAALAPKGLDLHRIVTEKNPKMFENIVHSFVGIAAIQVGLVDILTAVGIKPDYIIGHSVGELGCAYADGCLTAEQMVLAAYSRGIASIEAQTIKGSMAAVGLGHKQVKELCPPEIDVACHNSSDSSTISGPTEIMTKFIAELQKKEIFAREVNCSNIAYHSRYIANAGSRLLKYLQEVIPEPKLRSEKWLSSSVPASKWNSESAKYSTAEYHTNNLLNAVLFEETARHIHTDAITIEIAPHGLLQAILRRSLSKEVVNVALTQRDRDNCQVLLTAIGKLYEQGLEPDLAKMYPHVQFPVSRGTPNISSHVRWEHSDDWFVSTFHIKDSIASGERNVSISLDNHEHNFLTGHVIDGRNLYPVAGYLVLIWETLSLMRSEAHYTYIPVVFENVRFLRATNIPHNGSIDMHIMIQQGTGNFEITESGTIVITGHVHVPENVNQEIVQVLPQCKQIKRDNNEIHLTTRDIYKELKLRGYEYSGVFKGLVDCDNRAHAGHIEWRDNWVALIDNMLQIEILKKDTRELFIPTSIQKLTINVKQHELLIKKAEIEAAEDSSLKITATNDDIVNEPTALLLELRNYEHLNLICAGGIQIHGLKAYPITRRKPLEEPVLEKYEFVPFVNSKSMSLTDGLRVCVQVALENSPAIKVKGIEIDSVLTSSMLLFPLSPNICTILKDLPQIQPNFRIFTKRSIDGLPSDINVDNKKLTVFDNCHFVIGTELINKPDILQTAVNALCETGYIISREKCNQKLNNPAGFTIIQDVIVDNEHLVLLKEIQVSLPMTVINLNEDSCSDKFTWLKPLKEAILNNDIVLVVSEKQPMCGILGLINCIRAEPGGQQARCMFIVDSDAPKFDLHDPFYKHQLEKNIAINVYKNGQWGSYRHLQIENIKFVKTKNAYVKATTRGDLSSLLWLQGPVLDENNDRLLEIYYSALNFRDVMTATGKLALEVVAKGRLEQECVQGSEFSGRDKSGRRLMGMVSGGAIATRIYVNKELLWEIPDSWSLEDAATVPVVYSTAYYALVIKGKMHAGQTVLIHAGSGGVGQAAIHLALHYGCKVFTTVGTPEKREFIKQLYPQLTDNQIGNSRDTSFEKLIMDETNGQGVDLVLNSLAEEKLQASVRCLAKNGRFLEIGNFDLANNSALGMEIFLREISFHGIMLDNLFKAEPEEKRKLHKELANGIVSGAVKPLTRTVFNSKKVENAFRYMAAGKHIGKVLIKLRDEEQGQMSTPTECFVDAAPRLFCDPTKSYVIIGGLGGFGLELVDWLVLRGARKFVLTSRSGITKGYQSTRLRIWRSYGCQITVSNLNASTREGAAAVLHTAAFLAPVDGIFNLAVILKDALLSNQTTETFNAVFAGKAIATHHLDAASRVLCPVLRYFIVFSSVSCGRGNPGQTNYGMANSVMERICEARHSVGLPALAVQWGIVEDVDVVANMHDGSGPLKIGGYLQQRVTSCLACLDIFITQQAPIVTSMVVAEKGFKFNTSTVVDAVTKIMGLHDIKTVSVTSNFTELGRDSMINAEIKQMLEREFEVFITPQDIQSLTISKLQEINALQKIKIISSDNKNKESVGELEAVNMILGKIGSEEDAEEENIYMGIIDIKSNKPPIFLLPGIEGLASIFQQLSPHLEQSAICIQALESIQSIEELAEETLKVIDNNMNTKDDFTIIAYSFGAMVALEVVRKLEKRGQVGRLILVDGAPSMLQEITELFNNGSDLEVELICKILSEFNTSLSIEIRPKIEKCPDWKSRVELLVKHTPDFLPYSKQYLVTICTNAYQKVKAIMNYKPNWTGKLKSKVTLIRPKQYTQTNLNNDYNLSHYFNNEVSVAFFEGNHATILENEKALIFIKKCLNN